MVGSPVVAISRAKQAGLAGRIGLRARWHWLIPALTIATLMAPMVLTSRTFGQDWPNHLWLVWNQDRNIEVFGHPSLFLQSSLGAFFPWYAFYGGTLYSLAGGLSLVLGEHPTASFLVFHAAGFASAYLGMTWLAAQAGLRGWRTQLPGFVLVTSAYYLTNTYGRGAWPEMMAMSAIPLLAAAAVSIARSPRLRIRDGAALVAAAVIFTGSHNITLIWGSTFIAALLLVLLAARAPWLRLTRRRALAILGLLVLAVGVNMWFLAPNIAYGTRTLIAHGGSEFNESRLGTVLSLLRNTPKDDIATLNLQLPVLFLAWALAAGLVARRFARRAEAPVLIGLVALLGIMLVLLLSHWPWPAMPEPWKRIQSPWRVHSYAALVAAGLVLGALAWQARMPAGRGRGAMTAALVAVAVVAGVQGVVQVWGQPSNIRRSEVFNAPEREPESWYAPLDYADVGTTPRIAVRGPDEPALRAPAGEGPPRNSYTVTHMLQNDTLVISNFATGPNLIKVRGAKIVGHTGDGWAVLRFPREVRPRTTVRVRVEARRSALVWAGRAVSIASVLALAGLAVAALLRRRWREAYG